MLNKEFLLCYLVPHLPLTPVALRASLHLVIKNDTDETSQNKSQPSSVVPWGVIRMLFRRLNHNTAYPWAASVKAYDPTRGCDFGQMVLMESDAEYLLLLVLC